LGRFENDKIIEGVHIVKGDEPVRWYIGQFQNGKPEGLGILFFRNDEESKEAEGKMYVGQFKDGRRHGYGAFFWDSNENFYRGYWANGLRNGMGRLYNTHQQAKFGVWEAGELKPPYFNPTGKETLDQISIEMATWNERMTDSVNKDLFI
jgi:hypothetical protein